LARLRRPRGAARTFVCIATIGIATVAAAGCGSEAADSDGPTATMRITRDFGHELLSSQDLAPLEGRRTVLRLLKDHHDLVTGSALGWPDSIDGVRAGERGDSQSTWALNVNGIEADEEPRDYRLHPGDVVQWDRRDWHMLLDVRATVGAFPETFTRGAFGRRFPTTVECTDGQARACLVVKRALQRAGVAVDGSATGPLPPAGQVRRATVLVGPWKQLRKRQWARFIDYGARFSGVFAKFDKAAERIRLLDWDARTVRTVGAGSGLVAAQRPSEEFLLWTITGVDEAGVERAARAVGSDDLRDAFALVVSETGAQKVPLPLQDPDAPRNPEID
jgi:hypothetical protein